MGAVLEGPLSYLKIPVRNNNNITDDVNYTFSQSLNFFLNLSETGNSIYLRLYQP